MPALIFFAIRRLRLAFARNSRNYGGDMKAMQAFAMAREEAQ